MTNNSFSGLSLILQSPLAENPLFCRAEDNLVDKDSDKDDDDHDQHNLVDIGQVPAGNERLSKSDGCGHDLAAHEGSPGERPSLFHAGDQLRQGGREDHLPVDLFLVRAHGEGCFFCRLAARC